MLSNFLMEGLRFAWAGTQTVEVLFAFSHLSRNPLLKEVLEEMTWVSDAWIELMNDATALDSLSG